MPSRIAGPFGGRADLTIPDPQTSLLGRTAAPSFTCATRDPNLLERAYHVHRAWAFARVRHVPQAIVRHVEKDFYDLIEGLVPMVLVSFGLLAVTTGIGAAAGTLLGGVGAAPGAMTGLAVGMEILSVLGLGFLVAALRDQCEAIFAPIQQGAAAAWQSCGTDAELDAAAYSMADGVGRFYATLLAAMLAFLSQAYAARGLGAARRMLRESTLFKKTARLEAWIVANWERLHRKYLLKNAPGALPPVDRDINLWKRYVDTIEFNVPRDQGMLWTKIDRMDGPAKAREMAKAKGKTCLELELDKTPFEEGLNDVFGQQWSDAKREIFEHASTRYARSLTGHVTAVMDRRAWSAADRKRVAGRKYDFEGPIFDVELMEIIDVMETNSKIDSVTAIGLDGTYEFMLTREQVRGLLRRGREQMN